MYLPMVVYAQALYLPGMWVIFYLQSYRFTQPFPTGFQFQSSLIGCVGVVLVLMPLFWAYVQFQVVKVSAVGITCSNGFGKMVTVRWEEVVGIRKLYIPGLPYLLVSTTPTRLKLWLPLFLGNMQEFADKVEEYAGSEHVLYQAVWPHTQHN